MTEGSQRRRWSFRGRGPTPTERDWERSVLLHGRAAPCAPEFVSDGAGLPFAPAALTEPAPALDPGDPAVDALVSALRRHGSGASAASPSLRGWRVVARTDRDVLFARGVPPGLLTVAVQRDARGRAWRALAVTRDGELRRTRDGIRASGWELDPSTPLERDGTIIRVLVTEQTRSGGAFADGRLLEPDLYENTLEVMLAMFITPLSGVQIPYASNTPATPVRVQLAAPIGERLLRDGSLYEPD